MNYFAWPREGDRDKNEKSNMNLKKSQYSNAIAKLFEPDQFVVAIL